MTIQPNETKTIETWDEQGLRIELAVSEDRWRLRLAPDTTNGFIINREQATYLLTILKQLLEPKQ